MSAIRDQVQLYGWLIPPGLYVASSVFGDTPFQMTVMMTLVAASMTACWFIGDVGNDVAGFVLIVAVGWFWVGVLIGAVFLRGGLSMPLPGGGADANSELLQYGMGLPILLLAPMLLLPMLVRTGPNGLSRLTVWIVFGATFIPVALLYVYMNGPALPLALQGLSVEVLP